MSLSLILQRVLKNIFLKDSVHIVWTLGFNEKQKGILYLAFILKKM